VTLAEGEYELKLVARSAEGEAAQAAPLPTGGGVVILDTEGTPELTAEGLARDVIRVVQQARREAAFDGAARTARVAEAPKAVAAAVETHRDFVAAETLATSLELRKAGKGAFEGEVGDNDTVRVKVTRTAPA